MICVCPHDFACILSSLRNRSNCSEVHRTGSSYGDKIALLGVVVGVEVEVHNMWDCNLAHSTMGKELHMLAVGVGVVVEVGAHNTSDCSLGHNVLDTRPHTWVEVGVVVEVHNVRSMNGCRTEHRWLGTELGTWLVSCSNLVKKETLSGKKTFLLEEYFLF